MSRCPPLYPPPRPDCGRDWPPRWETPCRGCCAGPEMCADGRAMKLRLFGNCGGPGRECEPPLPPAAPPVTVVNPWNCREKAVVTLCVDECGNLVVYVKRL